MDGGGPSTITAPLAIEGGGGGERVMVAFLSPSGCVGHPRALWPRGASHFSCFAKKSNQKKATPTIRLIPAVLATRGTRTNRPMARKSARGGLMVRVYDRALLRSSGRIHGDPFELMLDRFAITITGARMRASGLRYLPRNLPASSRA